MPAFSRLRLCLLGVVAIIAPVMSGCSSNHGSSAAVEQTESVDETAPPKASFREARETTPPPMARGPGRHVFAACPMAVESVSTEVVDTDGGVALAFTTSEGDVNDLRRRVRETAQMYREQPLHRGWRWQHMEGRGRGAGPMAGQRSARGVGPGRGGLGPMPPADVTVEDVDQGARVIFTPKDATQLQALRDHLRAHRDRMMSNECPIRDDMPANDSSSDHSEPR